MRTRRSGPAHRTVSAGAGERAADCDHAYAIPDRWLCAAAADRRQRPVHHGAIYDRIGARAGGGASGVVAR